MPQLAFETNETISLVTFVYDTVVVSLSSLVVFRFVVLACDLGVLSESACLSGTDNRCFL